MNISDLKFDLIREISVCFSVFSVFFQLQLKSHRVNTGTKLEPNVPQFAQHTQLQSWLTQIDSDSALSTQSTEKEEGKKEHTNKIFAHR